MRDEQLSLERLEAEVHDHNEVDRMAAALDSHPDFKILRRMPTGRFEVVAPSGLKTRKVAILDVETTGLDPEHDKIIEFAALVLEVDAATSDFVCTVDSYEEFEDPGFSIPAEVTAINGIADTDVAGRRLDDARLANMFSGVHLVIAHNAGFDRQFVERRLPIFQEMKWACSLTQVDWKAEGIGSAKLDYLAYQLGFFYEAHRARADCMALATVLSSPLPRTGTTGLSQLLSASESEAIRIWATRAPFESKDILKGHGFSWDSTRKCWHLTVTRAMLNEEVRWMQDNAYGGRAINIELEVLDPTVRFSRRPGRLVSKSIPAAKQPA